MPNTEVMKYFNYFEFDSPDVQGSGQLMDKEVLDLVDQVRELYGKPIHITSGYRTEAHNEKVNGRPGSSHLKGLAIDVACTASADRYRLIELFMLVGFNRIGIADTFIHVDLDKDKVQNVIWTY